MICETCIPQSIVDTDREREILRVPMADCLDQLQFGPAQPHICPSQPYAPALFLSRCPQAPGIQGLPLSAAADDPSPMGAPRDRDRRGNSNVVQNRSSNEWVRIAPDAVV